jgi:hypothetical protein
LIFSWTQNDGRAGDHVVYPLDPETNTWDAPLTFAGVFSVTYPTFAAGYDPELGVTFIFTAGDSRDNGVMSAYCFKQATGAEKGVAGVQDGALSAAPNPFNPEVSITLTGSLARGATLKVYDLSGRLVADLSGKIRDNRAVWNAAGHASGMYLVAAKGKGLSKTDKIIYTK